MNTNMSSTTRRNVKALLAKEAIPISIGKVVKVSGLLVEVTMDGVGLGEQVCIETEAQGLVCEVVGFRDDMILAIPLGPMHGIAPGALVRRSPASRTIPVGDGLLGRVVDAFARPIDGGDEIICDHEQPVNGLAPSIEERAEVEIRFDTGVSVIDGMLTCGRGQRVGIFAGAGVGKSVLVEQIARQSFADVVVVGMIGERGREVRELLGSSIRSSMVIVAATSDKSPMERARGAKTATAIAEYFRDKGKNVLLVIDSVTRYCMALREIGLSVGEPPATKGYPPSVFAALPQLLERVAPMNHGGSITAFYTVLVEGDDLSDPVADSARSLLDGHIVLSRDHAARGQFPAVDILASTSRVASQVTNPETQALMQRCRRVLSTRKMVSDLQSLGAYTEGSNPEYDKALKLGREIDNWAMQTPKERFDYETTMGKMDIATGGSSK